MVKRALPPLFVLLLAASFSSANAAQDSPPPKPAQPAEVRALFVANCAQCHGEKGDGEGVTQLDRKARSFLDGGFSYGNTKDAILRSITHGIPGTPMPSFEKALDETQRTALAQYVIAFGPDQIVVDPSESEMVVKDRPLVVRGKLPAIVEGGPEWPRGLAIGTPDGLTFEYRADDVRLLAVRAGRFVNRTDWGDRGGSALEMLGKVIWTATPEWNPTILSLAYQHPQGPSGVLGSRHARLLATETTGGGVVVEYLLTGGEGKERRQVKVREVCSAFRNRWGSGCIVTSTLRSEASSTFVTIARPEPGSARFFGKLGEGRGLTMSEKAEFYAGTSRGNSSNEPWLVVHRRRTPAPWNFQIEPLFEVVPDKDLILEVIVLTDLSLPIDLPSADKAQLDQLVLDFTP